MLAASTGHPGRSAYNSDGTRDLLSGLVNNLPAIGFLGAPACNRQTLPAALPTDGTATPAQLAAAYNALRAEEVCFGLAQ